MSPAAARLLPRTRTFQRRRPWTAWWLAAGVAVVVNLGLVLLLSQISHLHAALPEAPQTVRTIRQVEPELPPPPPERPEQPPEPVSEPLAVALPTLELPPAPSPQALSLPEMPHLEATFDLPLAVPAFAALVPSAEPAAPGAPVAVAEPDQPAELRAAFDLERFYPRSARLRGVSGRSRVRITIDTTGVVSAVNVLEATPPGVFDRATENLGRSLLFTPAKSAGKPVVSIKELIIDWTLK